MRRKKWARDLRRNFRHKRNLTIFFKLQFIFVIQILLLFSMLWAINIVDYIDGTHKAGVGLSGVEEPYVNLITKFVAAIILHVNM